MICPMMSEIIRSRFKGTTENTDGNEDLCRVNCLGKDCALWVVEGVPHLNDARPTGSGGIAFSAVKYQERCGLIK